METMLELTEYVRGKALSYVTETGETMTEFPLSIVDFVIETRKASASLLQRRFKVGYNRAARIVDLLEERGIIGPPNGSKPREVLIKNDNIEGEEE